MTDVIDYLDLKNVSYERQGEEVLILCPYCNKQKLSINIKTGVYKCWICQAEHPSSPYVKGHISFLQKEWGDILEVSSPFYSPNKKKEEPDPDFTELALQQHKEIFNQPKALKYLFRRGFNEDDIKKFKFGYREKLGEQWIAIPCIENDQVTLIKYRKFTSNNEKIAKYDREKGGKSTLYNIDILRDSDFLEKYDNEINITEGEIDCITMLKHGYENTVGMTVGASTLKEEWYDLLIQVQKVNLILDSDSVGQSASENVWAKRLGYNRCWNVLLPEDCDVNEFFRRYDNFDEVKNSAVQFKIKGVKSLQKVLYEMYERSKDKDHENLYELPWENVNKRLGGGFREGRLTVVSGVPGTGKTSWAMQICYHFAKQGTPVFFFCMEMPEIELATKIIQLQWNLTTSEIPYSDALIYENELRDLPLYLGYSSKITPDVFYNTMVEVRNRYGVEFGVFDNFHRMVRTGREHEEGKASGMFKDITMDLGMPFLLIGQPRKKNQEQESNNNFMPTRESIKGSSAIPADADEVILLHRRQVKEEEGNATFESVTKIIIDKSRYSSGGVATLNFLGAKSRFEEII